MKVSHGDDLVITGPLGGHNVTADECSQTLGPEEDDSCLWDVVQNVVTSLIY